MKKLDEITTIIKDHKTTSDVASMTSTTQTTPVTVNTATTANTADTQLQHLSIPPIRVGSKINPLHIFDQLMSSTNFSSYLYGNDINSYENDRNWSSLLRVSRSAFIIFNKSNLRDKRRTKALLKAVCDANPASVISILSPSPLIVELLKASLPLTDSAANVSSMAKPSASFSEECIILAKSQGIEGYLSQNTKKIVPRRIWKNASSLEAAAWMGDVFTVILLCNYVPGKLIPMAALQLQTVMDTGTEHGIFLAPYLTVIDALKAYTTKYKDLCKQNDFDSLNKLLIQGIGKPECSLPNYGFQELYDCKYFVTEDNISSFKIPPARLLFGVSTNDYHLNLDNLGVQWALVKGEFSGANCHGSGKSRTVWVEAQNDARAFAHFINIRRADIKHIIQFLLENNGVHIAPKVLHSEDKETIDLIHHYLDQQQGKNLDGAAIVKLRRYVRKKPKLEENITNNLYYLNNIYTIKNVKGITRIALDESVVVFHAEDVKKRRLYILKEKLGSGTHGAVKKTKLDCKFVAVNSQTNQERVLKIIFFGWKANQDREHAIEMAKMEAELNDSEGYIIREDKEKIYIDLPYHPGKDLDAYFMRNEITNLDEKIQIAIKILEQLKIIHDKGYLHRDLKPSNIMYDQKTGELHIVDKALAVKANKTTSPEQKKRFGELWYNLNQLQGTSAYIAPEISSGNYSEKSEIFAVGRIFNYHWDSKLSLGFGENSATATARKNPFFPSLQLEHDRLKNLVSNMLNKDPSLRIGLEEALNELYAIQKLRAEQNPSQDRKKSTVASSATATSKENDEYNKQPNPLLMAFPAVKALAASTSTVAPSTSAAASAAAETTASAAAAQHMLKHRANISNNLFS